MTEQDAEMLAGVLGQCRELVHLDLNGNFMNFGPSGAESFVGVLAQVAALAHLDLSGNWEAGQRVLQECWGSAGS